MTNVNETDDSVDIGKKMSTKPPQQPQSVELDRILMDLWATDPHKVAYPTVIPAAKTALTKLIASVANEAELKGRIDEIDRSLTDNVHKMEWSFVRKQRERKIQLVRLLNQSEGKR